MAQNVWVDERTRGESFARWLVYIRRAYQTFPADRAKVRQGPDAKNICSIRTGKSGDCSTVWRTWRSIDRFVDMYSFDKVDFVKRWIEFWSLLIGTSAKFEKASLEGSKRVHVQYLQVFSSIRRHPTVVPRETSKRISCAIFTPPNGSPPSLFTTSCHSLHPLQCPVHLQKQTRPRQCPRVLAVVAVERPSVVGVSPSGR